ncbi:MAG: TonB-dependent receptor [Planctomycetes bacterium]|nr:TonB-dependent receptor [Planctomycetota bacterium]
MIKGPYSARYGPGFDFVDFQLMPTPRYLDGPERHGSTSLEYLTNGQQWYGRQSVWGGNESFGYRVSYGHRTGSDYETGNGSRLPTSYNSRDLDVALGYDISPDSHLEFTYLRLDQSDVEFPGLVFDINALETDGLTLQYTLENQAEFDLLTVEGWYNRTAFDGDTFRSGKNIQIPSLVDQLQPAGSGSAATNVDAYSSGYRLATSWGDAEVSQVTAGTDLIYLGQQLNEIEDPTGLARNYPIPRSHSSDIGLFADYTTVATDRLKVNAGGRVDFVSTDARNLAAGEFFDLLLPGVTDYSSFKQAGLDQNFALWSLFTTAEYEINDCWTATGGAGYGQRPPSLTELYAGGSFIGSTQAGLSFLEGDPELDAEKRLQIDLGIQGDLGCTRVALNGYYAWINDYITFEDIERNAINDFFNMFFPTPQFVPGQDFQRLAYTNTDLATLAGFEFAVEQDLDEGVIGFATVSYVEGRDHTRNEVSRLAAIRRAPFTPPFFTGTENRSLVDNDDEPLPGIVPLEARVGLRWREPVADPSWGLELEARIVDNQDRVATSLFEQVTPGFTIWNLRGFWRPYDDFTVIAGVENFTNKYYQEHLDYRSGLGVYQPGANFYCSTELTY